MQIRDPFSCSEFSNAWFGLSTQPLGPERDVFKMALTLTIWMMPNKLINLSEWVITVLPTSLANTTVLTCSADKFITKFVICKYFLSCCGLPFTFLMAYFRTQKLSILIKFNLLFSFLDHTSVLYLRILCQIQCYEDLLLCFLPVNSFNTYIHAFDPFGNSICIWCEVRVQGHSSIHGGLSCLRTIC